MLTSRYTLDTANSLLSADNSVATDYKTAAHVTTISQIDVRTNIRNHDNANLSKTLCTSGDPVITRLSPLTTNYGTADPCTTSYRSGPPLKDVCETFSADVLPSRFAEAESDTTLLADLRVGKAELLPSVNGQVEEDVESIDSVLLAKWTPVHRFLCRQPSCHYIITHPLDYVKHMSYEHPCTPQPVLIVCDLCPFVTDDNADIQEHYSHHRSTKALKCKICNVVTSPIKLVMNHGAKCPWKISKSRMAASSASFTNRERCTVVNATNHSSASVSPFQQRASFHPATSIISNVSPQLVNSFNNPSSVNSRSTSQSSVNQTTSNGEHATSIIWPNPTVGINLIS